MTAGYIVFGVVAAGALLVSQLHAQNPPMAAASVGTGPTSVDSQPTPATAHVSPRVMLDRYCVGCHNDRAKTGGLTLQKIDVDHVGDDAAVWEKVLQKLETNAMPPVGRPRPDHEAVGQFTSWLETSLDSAAAANPNPGQPGVHRLNRTEYVNAIRDVLALKIDGAALLPADTSGYGFDNIADVLSVSPGLLDRYMIAAQTVSRIAVGDPSIRPVVDQYKQLELLRQEDRVDEDLPFGTRGGVVADHNFPVDAEYTIHVRLQRTLDSVIRGVNEQNVLEVYLDGSLLKQFTIYCQPNRKGGTSQNDGLLEACAQNADADLEVRLPVKAGPHRVGAAFLKHSAIKEGLGLDRVPIVTFTYSYGRNTQVSVDSLEVGGPYQVEGPGESPSRRRIFVCHPSASQDDALCAKRILATIARRAYRRPVTDVDLQPLMAFYETGRRERNFDGGIELALKAILVSPNFLFRIERAQAPADSSGVFHVSDIDLASRLSFFLWSSVPDDELLDLAAKGRLHTQPVLTQQVKRLLADERASALVSNFGGQWLYLRNLSDVKPDANEYPDFDDNLREAFQRETELFFTSQLHDDRPIIDMLKANYTFVNERLAEFYGIPNVTGSHFRQVTLADDRRTGLLGQASILLATSYGNRTSPVLRGKWLLENVLGAPPPSPPPDVPPLPEEEGTATPRTMRARMEQHRKNPACASCHAHIDPLGFALENFDAIGHWRSTEGGKPIDASGVLVDGTKFNGAAELRRMLIGHEDEFALTVTKKLFTYALGRGVDYYDMPTVRRILRESQPMEHTWSSIIMGIVTSAPFQMEKQS
jgi:mono/diheme cytochrome c family protein